MLAGRDSPLSDGEDELGNKLFALRVAWAGLEVEEVSSTVAARPREFGSPVPAVWLQDQQRRVGVDQLTFYRGQQVVVVKVAPLDARAVRAGHATLISPPCPRSRERPLSKPLGHDAIPQLLPALAGSFVVKRIALAKGVFQVVPPSH